MGLTSELTSTYTTFSGIDITAMFDNMVLATLSGVASSLTREKVPVYTFGSANARSISRGKRACAGSLQFTLFDRDAFYELFKDPDHMYYAHADEVNYLTNPVNVSEFKGLYYGASSTFGAGDQAGVTGGTANTLNTGLSNATTTTGNVTTLNNAPRTATTAAPDVGALSIKRSAQHADQVMPFDITLIAQNEYGRATSSAIVGVEIINEGGGISVDDITNEQQMTYIAITKMPWIALNDNPSESLFGKITSLVPRDGTGADAPVILNASGGEYQGTTGSP